VSVRKFSKCDASLHRWISCAASFRVSCDGICPVDRMCDSGPRPWIRSERQNGTSEVTRSLQAPWKLGGIGQYFFLLESTVREIDGSSKRTLAVCQTPPQLNHGTSWRHVAIFTGVDTVWNFLIHSCLGRCLIDWRSSLLSSVRSTGNKKCVYTHARARARG